MAIVSNLANQITIQDSSFKTAGYLSFINAFLTLPMIIAANIALDKGSAGLWIFALIPLSSISCVFTIYTFLQFKRLLGERYDIHNLGNVITALIVCAIIINVKNPITAILMVTVKDPGFVEVIDSIMGLPFFLFIGILGVIFGLRLLSINYESSGLMRIYAIMNLISSAFMVSVILILIGLLLSIPNNIILGILFLKEAEAEPQVEFV